MKQLGLLTAFCPLRCSKVIQTQQNLLWNSYTHWQNAATVAEPGLRPRPRWFGVRGRGRPLWSELYGKSHWLLFASAASFDSWQL